MKHKTEWSRSTKLVVAELAVILVCWLAYVIFGASAVSFIYHKGLVRPLQPDADHGYMVAHYVERADRAVLLLLGIGLLAVTLQAMFLRFRQHERAKVRTVAIASGGPAAVSGNRYFIFSLLTVALTCSLILGILVVSNRLFVHRLAVWKMIDEPSFNNLRRPVLNERQVLNLGWAHVTEWAPASSYIYRSFEKPPGTYRIGAFGDSFTEGEETGPGHDFPSFLQEQLRAAGGGKRYEVINFGVRGYGMQQAFLMYEYLGKRYDLDAAIFMPFEFFYERDNTFKLHSSVGALHARYILDGDGLRLVTIDEETPGQAFENYYSLLPSTKYLRYDANSANLVTTFAVSGHVPRYNLLYYAGWRGYASELRELYLRMFAKVAEEIGKVFVVGNDALIDALNINDLRNVSVLKSRLNANSFLLRGPKGHLSALGNQMRAAEISQWITGQQPELKVPIISNSAYRPTGEEDSLARISLTDVSEAWLEIEGHPAAGFFMREPGHPLWRISGKVDFGQQGIRGIIQVRDGARPQEQPVFVPVDFPIEDDAPLEIRIFSPGGITTEPIGKIDCVANSLCRARFNEVNDLQQIRLDREGKHLAFAAYHQVSIRSGYFDAVDVLVSGRPILSGQRQNRVVDLARRFVLARSPDAFINKFELKPLIADYVFLRAKAGQYVDPRIIARRGSIQTALRRKDGAVLHLGSFLQYAFP